MKTQKSLSNKSTGFKDILIETILDNGDIETIKVIKIEIDLIQDIIVVKYVTYTKDSNGGYVGTINHKQYVTRDEYPIGDVEFDDNGDVVEGSWKEEKPESLNVTKWEKSLGKTIRDSIINKLKEIEK